MFARSANFFYGRCNILKKSCKNILRIKMASQGQLEKIKENANLAKQTITGLKSELEVVNNQYNKLLAEQLREENVRLMAAVEEAKKRLVAMETINGVKQIPLPQNQRCLGTDAKAEQAPTTEKKEKDAAAPKQDAKPKKEKKPKEAKEPKEATGGELPVDIGRLDLRVGKVESVERHPDADSLYVLKINCGEDKPRTVCSGLVKHIPIGELRDRSVMLLCNLKPAKMRGITSEAMVMCASSEQGVEVLLPPPGVSPGEPVACEGFTRNPDPVMNPKKKIFETVAPDLHTNGNLEACYKNVPLKVEGKGVFVAKTLKNVPVK